MKIIISAFLFITLLSLPLGAQTLLFDGYNDIIALEEFSQAHKPAFTVSLEVTVNKFESRKSGANYIRQFIFFKENTNEKYFNEAYTLYVDEYRKCLWATLTSKDKKQVHIGTGINSIETGKPYKVTVIAGPEFAEIYLNGVLKSRALTGFPIDHSNKALLLGGRLLSLDDKYQYGGRFNGVISNLKFYDGIYSPEELEAFSPTPFYPHGTSSSELPITGPGAVSNIVPEQDANFQFENPEMLIYPNPANGNISVEYAIEADGEYSFDIKRENGSSAVPVERKHLDRGNYETQIDVSSLVNGLYYLILSGPTGALSGEFIINR